ncbi:peptidoglycan-associated lipoprotein Pal [Halobacteriovorax sp. GB3]|uniref:peptidoglycan-associated lipoprotein Pal n=1 Tax=Halobacteriovorax sp. GB3 TaxID=2719615 RepID=UPI0023625412|nr:peptidoglycan-associated lipoprotein Pal [Halobacteriovorax sp. GB3]MDD0851589.1 peptidoglycan-associated lipoprotein Pal [Halobacteriovorax sp. GB3]
MKKLNALALTLILSATMSLTGCGSSQKKADETNTPTEMANDMGASNDIANLELNADSDSGKAASLQTVYFDFNSANLKADTKAALDNNAEFLKKNTTVEVQVEGHCDERGGVQYNLALGERRAAAIKNYLVALGVESSRITTISFGKMRPISFGHTESAWSQNRRGNFVVTAK